MRKMQAHSLADLVRMSTKLEPLLRKLRDKDAAKQQLEGEAMTTTVTRGPTYRLPDMDGAQAVRAIVDAR